MRKMILPFSALTFSGLIAQADSLDDEIKELKDKGFDVEIVENKLKVYSDEEYNKKTKEEELRQ